MRPACQQPARALMLAWKQLRHDQRDAQLFRTFARLSQSTNARGRHLILAGLAGFQR